MIGTAARAAVSVGVLLALMGVHGISTEARAQDLPVDWPTSSAAQSGLSEVQASTVEPGPNAREWVLGSTSFLPAPRYGGSTWSGEG